MATNQYIHVILLFQSLPTYLSPPRLLTLWFDYGHYPDVHDAVTDGLKTIDIDTWLQVI